MAKIPSNGHRNKCSKNSVANQRQEFQPQTVFNMILNTILAANKLRERDLKIDKYKFLKQAWNKFAKKSAAT